MKLFLFFFLITCLNLYSQQVDSAFTDSVKIIPDTSFTGTDSLASDTTGLFMQQPDTLYPLYQTPFSEKSFFISKQIINKLDYRFTGNLFVPAAFTYLKDKGMIGQPGELILYGIGFGGTGFFTDGILFNNRYTNILDLNFIQSETIDSIEVLPLPRGFLYGADNYLVSVNFIEKDFISPAPYTRIKYYEGPEGEAFVDGIFNASFLNKFNFSFYITNRNFDGIYTNSDFSIWQANVKLKYFLSNFINLTGSYSLVSSNLGFFGGVDIDSASKISSDVNSVIFDPSLAPVVNPALRQQVDLDKFNIKALAKFGKFRSDLNFYYQQDREKYSDASLNDEIKNYVFETSLRQSFSSSAFHFEVNSVFEKRDLNYYRVDTTIGFQNYKMEYDIFSVSPVVSLYLIDSSIVPSLFYKYSKISGLDSHSGIGADVSINFLRWISLYSGFSSYYFLNRYKTATFEIGMKFNSQYLNGDLKYYGSEKSLPPFFPSPGITFPFLIEQRINNIKGYSASLIFDIWRIGIEGRVNYNLFEGERSSVSSLIKLYSNTGIFYKDILFNNNLDLKTGFVLKYYDFESEEFKSANQLDFTLAGIIQEVAIVYFTWENLFDEQYFIVPYHPMRERGIRFGLSWELFN